MFTESRDDAGWMERRRIEVEVKCLTKGTLCTTVGGGQKVYIDVARSVDFFCELKAEQI